MGDVRCLQSSVFVYDLDGMEKGLTLAANREADPPSGEQRSPALLLASAALMSGQASK